ncbi:hypothetical protein V2J09_004334 [Rumex salicifolius]
MTPAESTKRCRSSTTLSSLQPATPLVCWWRSLTSVPIQGRGPRQRRSEPGLGLSGSDLGFGGGSPSGLAADATVCKTGCDYGTVQEAVKAAPSDLEGTNRHGLCGEIVRVGFEKKNLVFFGDGIGKTVITASLNTGVLRITTYNTATVGE